MAGISGIWEGSGRDLGGFGEILMGFERDLKGFGKGDLAGFGGDLGGTWVVLRRIYGDLRESGGISRRGSGDK